LKQETQFAVKDQIVDQHSGELMESLFVTLITVA
jgi:hypothetical protein